MVVSSVGDASCIDPLRESGGTMDLNTIDAIVQPGGRAEIPAFAPGDAFLGGGTWLFSEPQAHLRRLVDLSSLRWPALTVTEAGLEIAATCTLAELNAAKLPADWKAAGLIPACCRALMGSFKVWNMATVGGNICTALPAGPMISLAAALDGTCHLWGQDGEERILSIFDLITGAGETALRPGELLRSIHLPAARLARRAAVRRASLTQLGRSAVLVIGTVPSESNGFDLTLTAAVPRPLCLTFPAMPDAAALAARITKAVPPKRWHDDVHGRPDWRRAMTLHLAEEIRQELAGA